MSARRAFPANLRLPDAVGCGSLAGACAGYTRGVPARYCGSGERLALRAGDPVEGELTERADVCCLTNMVRCGSEEPEAAAARL